VRKSKNQKRIQYPFATSSLISSILVLIVAENFGIHEHGKSHHFSSVANLVLYKSQELTRNWIPFLVPAMGALLLCTSAELLELGGIAK
jgi:hypothetical protein